MEELENKIIALRRELSASDHKDQKAFLKEMDRLYREQQKLISKQYDRIEKFLKKHGLTIASWELQA